MPNKVVVAGANTLDLLGYDRKVDVLDLPPLHTECFR